LKLSSLVLFVLGGLTFLGSLSVTVVGIKLYALLEKYLGEKAWIAPFVLLILAVIGWFSSSQPLVKIVSRNAPGASVKQKGQSKHEFNGKRRQSAQFSPGQNSGKEGIELPPSKLVSLRGFDQYFASSELQIHAVTREDLEELGTDFNSYFKGGQKDHSSLPKRLQPVDGFKTYFRSAEDQGATNSGVMDVKTSENLNKTSNLSEPLQTLPSIKDYISLGKHDEPHGSGAPRVHPHSSPKIGEGNDFNCEGDGGNGQRQDIKIFQDTGSTSKTCDGPRGRDGSGPFTGFAEPANQRRHQGKWILPDTDLLNPAVEISEYKDIQEDNSRVLEEVLHNFGISCQVVNVSRGPVVTRYELVPAPGVKISRIVNLADDIALALAAKDVRIEAPIPGKSAVGIEVPNKQARVVGFREVIESDEYRNHQSPLKVALGVDISGHPVVADIMKMPHLLVAGATGSGKSVCVNSLIFSILFNATPEKVKLLLIDPKMVELSNFNGIPHLLAPVVTDSRAAASFLKWTVKEMETRYELFAARGVRDIAAYNALCSKKHPSPEDDLRPLPYIVVVIDELADLMMVSAHEVEEAIARLAQMARAAGIHLVIATQRPSVDVITGVIKANIPSRIAFAVSSQIDSRTILDCAGAERLLGKGDMLFAPIGLNKPLRVQGCFIADEEANRVIEHWKCQGKPEYLVPETVMDGSSEASETGASGDELFLDAARLVITTGMASASFLQRKLKIGYARAARLIDLLEEEGVIGGYEGPKPRQVLMDMDRFLQKYPQ